MNWQHYAVDEPTFQAPWTALQAAVQLAHAIGESPELRIDLVSLGKPKRCRPKVSFSSSLQLVVEYEDANIAVNRQVPFDDFCQWSNTPWISRSFCYPFLHGDNALADPLPNSVLISDSRPIDHDVSSFMQTAPKVHQLRDALPIFRPLHLQATPGHGDDAFPQRHHRPDDDDPMSGDDETEVTDDSASSSSAATVLQCVCLYHLDDPPVYGCIDWTDYVQMMHDAAMLLQIDDDQLLGLFDIEVTLPDLPPDVVPLIAYIVEDVIQGGLRSLALVDIEVHANQCEAHYFTAPTIDRSVIPMPLIADRRAVFQTAEVDLYCAHERDRCLLYHNLQPIFTQLNPRLNIRSGAYLKIILPPPEGCDLPTGQVLHYSRVPPDIDFVRDNSPSALSGYSPSLVPSEEIRQEYGRADDVGLLQIDIQTTLPSFRMPKMPTQLQNGQGLQCSFTDDFLRTVRLWQQAADDIPEFPAPADDISNFAPWIQDLHEVWQDGAHIGPGNVEMLARLETWFSDHWNYQRCYNSRMAVLGADYDNWEFQLKQLWRERIMPGAVIEFFMVSPLPEDAAAQTIGQLIIVQRPVRFQRSIIVSVYDNEYDQGRPHSMAIVTGDRVDTQSVKNMIDAIADCPPEQPSNACALWFGNRQFQPEERAYARHGHAFRFLIHRRRHDAWDNMTDLDDLHLRDRVASLNSGQALPFPLAHMVHSPAWMQELRRHFDDLAAVEREDEGQVAYVQTWHLNGLRAPRCQSPRAVRLRNDATAWFQTLIMAWRDRIDVRLNTDIFWIDPTPVNSPRQSFIGHLIVAQELQSHHGAVLLSATTHRGTQEDSHYVALHHPDRLSHRSAIEVFPIPSTLMGLPISVRRDSQLLPEDGSMRIGHGDHIAIDIIAPSDTTTNDQDPTAEPTAFLQTSMTRSSTQAAGTPIALADHIPAPVWTSIDCSKIDFLRRQLLEHCPGPVLFDTSTLSCSKATLRELASIEPWTHETPTKFEFFTDGSYRRAHLTAAAGVVMIVHTSEGQRFGGYQSAWCWQAPSAPRSEATAVILALHWAMSMICYWGYTQIPIDFHYDSTYVGQVAQGQSASISNNDMTAVVRSLALWTEQLHGCKPRWFHVKGHSDHPWNDLADTIAASVRTPSDASFDMTLLMNICTFDALDLIPLQWLWLYERSLWNAQDAPILHGLQWRVNCIDPLTSVPLAENHPFMLRHPHTSTNDEEIEAMWIRCATANVLTMYPDQKHASTFFGVRAEHLEGMFTRRKVQCIGLQETRSKRQGHDVFGSFHVFSSPATARGCNGMQLWFARTLHTSQGPIQFGHEHFRILHGDERRLIVRLRHPSLKLLLIVLHAPSEDDFEVVRQWWTTTSSLIPSGMASWTWFVMCDANSRVGSIQSKAIGSFGATTENERGAIFHEWLCSHGLWLPQTFEQSHIGPHDTWTHPTLARARIDFIGITDNIAYNHVSTWVEDEIDLSLARKDHECVCADICLPLIKTTTPSSSAPNAQLSEWPLWHHDVHTHAALLQNHFTTDAYQKESHST